MKKPIPEGQAIPVSVSIDRALETEHIHRRKRFDKRRLLYISGLAVAVAVLTSVLAKALVYLIDLFTNFFFFGTFSFHETSPADHQMGNWVVLIPVAGGVLVGLIAYYGASAIRGHGIPEAMEQVLTNESRIRPAMTYLKPLSAAISIGTGGPFGAEGPIIATGGALGSTAGQWLKITAQERKVLLAAGATAGMSAIFGSPLAAVFLAIELLLFEFSPRSMLPVALACITGAAGHHFLFDAGPVFPVGSILPSPSNTALFLYSMFGLVIGLASVLTTKLLYLIEDLFEKLPVHWMWWPAIGGAAVGIIGIAEPRTMGVGYFNIVDLLQGSATLQFAVILGVLKFTSWVIALGSGTSGGTLAPLLTIGACLGLVLNELTIAFFPEAGINASMSALVGMAAMFAGASRALLTSIVFALEVTHQTNALIPLLACCTGSFLVSFFLMENTIMTEKIARRGIRTPDSFVPDVLDRVQAGVLTRTNVAAVRDAWTATEARVNLAKQGDNDCPYYVIVDSHQHYLGIGTTRELIEFRGPDSTKVAELPHFAPAPVSVSTSLRKVLTVMNHGKIEALAVYDLQKEETGIITYNDIMNAFSDIAEE